MKKEIRRLIIIAVLWIFLKIFEYYLVMPLFLISAFWLLGFFVLFLIIFIYQIIRLIVERKNLKKIRIIKALFWGLIFYFTVNFKHAASIIEKADWHILYRKRMEIVEQVKNKELNPNVDWNDDLCELPFEFPIVSISGNDIIIERNERTQTTTVAFFVNRGMLSSSTCFIYTNDDENIRKYNSLIRKDSESNWKLKENWYRIRKD